MCLQLKSTLGTDSFDDIQDITHDYFGANMNAEAQGTYSASSVKNDFFYETTVVSKGRSAWDEHFSGSTRIALAKNRAIANNFIEFIRRFQTYVKTNTQALWKNQIKAIKKILQIHKRSRLNEQSTVAYAPLHVGVRLSIFFCEPCWMHDNEGENGFSTSRRRPYERCSTVG